MTRRATVGKPAAPAGIAHELSAFVRRIVAKASPVKIVLFGSRAGGRPRPDSDVDLCVIADRRDSRRLTALIYGLERSFPLDLVVLTPGQVRWRLREGDFFLREILERGIILYEAPHARVG